MGFEQYRNTNKWLKENAMDLYLKSESRIRFCICGHALECHRDQRKEKGLGSCMECPCMKFTEEASK